jgi:hypothetical protein
MPIIVPAVMLVVLAVAVLAAGLELVWRHHLGAVVEAELRSYQDPSTIAAPAHTRPMAA